MERTVKEITKELGTNKNVVYRIIEKLELSPVPSGDNKAVKVYSDKSFNAIKEEFKNIQSKHAVAKVEKSSRSENTEMLLSLRKQIERYENEIERLNKVIESKENTISEKDKQILKLTDELTETIKASHIETVRYQELLAREQNTKLLLTSQAQSRFNIFKPSTWKRNQAAQTPDLEPLTPDETNG